jgi:hypothetical protein
LRAEFDEHVQRIGARAEAPTEPHLAAIARLRQQLADERVKSARYRSERDDARRAQETLANQVSVLDQQNRRLEAKLGDEGKRS